MMINLMYVELTDMFLPCCKHVPVQRWLQFWLCCLSAGFLYFWGIVFLLLTTLIMVFKKEYSSTEPSLGVVQTYHLLWNITRLPSIRMTALILLTSKVSSTVFCRFLVSVCLGWIFWRVQFAGIWSTCKNVKVKVTPVQALRLCTGHTDHRRSRSIDLPFHDHSTRRGWGVSVTPRPLFTPVKTRYQLYRRLGGPQGRSGQVQKISPPTGIRSPDCPARSQSLYRLRCPTRLKGIVEQYIGWMKNTPPNLQIVRHCTIQKMFTAIGFLRHGFWITISWWFKKCSVSIMSLIAGCCTS